MKRITVEVVLLVDDLYELTMLHRAREVLVGLAVYPEFCALEKFEIKQSEVVTTQP